ncbi:MAG: PASTA domain-containing protein [Bacteroidales bacterium]|nr:PASTA domain-containing protein [Bacteroidales bacterium]MBR5092555.1 PASTA domain-containing protein [Bacteroidales bacterium]
MAKENFFKRFPWALHLLIMLGVSLVVLMVVLFFIRIYARQGEEYELPDVVGRNIAELQDDNPIELDVVVMDSIFRPGEAGGLILTQDPKAGTMVKKGRKLYITMTAYTPEDAVLPELAGLTVRQAVNELYAEGLVVGKLKFVEDPYKNNVIDQTCKGKTLYAGQQIERGSVVDLVVGLGDGSGRSVVPFTIGKTADRARRDIVSASLNVGREHYSGVKHRQTAVVCRQEPDYTGVSKYPYGTSVDLWFIDADATDVDRMVREFKVDSSKIEDPNFIDDGRPTPDEIEANEEWSW